jgi:uncharacterized protein YcbK (DUF882 family)
VALAPSPDAFAVEEPAAPLGPPVAWAQALGPITIENANTGAHASVRLYAPDGSIDPVAFQAFAGAVGNGTESAPIHPRVVQLAIKVAYQVGAKTLVVISAYRPAKPGSGGPHASGDALDFQLPGTDSRKLASLLRAYPRAGVGIYTHPRTQYVHLDVRDKSFHWLDGSPPGRTWREAPLTDKNRDQRDSAYLPEGDLPIKAPK